MIHPLGSTNPRRYHYPWREGGSFQLLSDGQAFYPEMLTAIENAASYIALEVYLFESGQIANRFIDALTAAASRGISIYLLLDDFGARLLNSADRDRLESSGLNLHFYNPLRWHKRWHNFRRDHRKILIVDNRVAFTGGFGITDSFADASSSTGIWHDLVVKMGGPVIADWRNLFVRQWQRQTGHPPELPLAAVKSNGAMSGRLLLDHPPHRLEINRAVLKRVRAAEYRLWISTPYFVPSRKLRRALRRAVARDVDVRLLLPGPVSDHPSVRRMGRRFFGRLLRHGVRIFEYQPRFNHTKLVLCDHWLTIGSSNFDRWSIGRNLEANLAVDNDALAASAKRLLEQDFALAAEIEHHSWHSRGWLGRLQEQLMGVVDHWIRWAREKLR